MREEYRLQNGEKEVAEARKIVAESVSVSASSSSMAEEQQRHRSSNNKQTQNQRRSYLADCNGALQAELLLLQQVAPLPSAPSAFNANSNMARKGSQNGGNGSILPSMTPSPPLIC
eukprot:TRINITY_DN11740_c0_g2_i1.p2 TRINITY_DN11740_c0_g2~~TRINITY_DN11740_c0_g2_i1.p2  ORF type:complete len:116 (+),score=11.86 TRINITY_DN11740_c0_g2_i1:368-715(+)